MYWVQIGNVHYNLAEALIVHDEREPDPKKTREAAPGGPGPKQHIPSAWIEWKHPTKKETLFQGRFAGELMNHFEAFKKTLAQAPKDSSGA